MIYWLSSIYILAALGLALFGILGLVTLWAFWRHRDDAYPCPEVDEDYLPQVTVQLPIFNERLVVERLINASVNLDYPREKLQILIVDDSDDATTEIARTLVNHHRAQGSDICLVRRHHRDGFKAGALEGALRHSRGQFIAVFDADFRPNPDFLKRTVPYFLDDEQLGMVQTRWGHLNPSDSNLTAAQTIALDKHFVMEQTVRHRANFYPKFNGSAGIWRKECIADSGGWQADTVCEDLCLSTRAILRGWKFLFLNDVVSPAELPTTISAYKNQQARWAKGSTQCLVKFAPAIIKDDRNTRLARIYALLSMAGYITHMLMLLLLLVQIPLVYLGFKPPVWFILFGVIGLAQPALFVLAQREIYPDWRTRLRHFPALILIAIGLAAANVRAILQAVISRDHVFIRTPKKGNTPSGKGLANESAGHFYKLSGDWIVAGEMFLSLYALVGLILCLQTGNVGPIFFMLACTLGFGYVSVSSLREYLQ